MNERNDSSSSSDAPPPALDVETVRASLDGLPLGTPLHYFPALPSTNSYAATLARAGASEGTLVTTDDQTAGRGRIGRTWIALPGQMLALSLVLRPTFPPHFLVLGGALAVAEAIDEQTGLHATLKWPNDVLLGGRKVCGILIEVSDGVAILGIGLNVNGSFAADAELGARAVTLQEAAGHPVAREPLLVALLRRLALHYQLLQTGGDDARRTVRASWRDRLGMLGSRVTIRQQGGATFSGLAEDVSSDGALLLRLDDGTLRTVTWGDVEV